MPPRPVNSTEANIGAIEVDRFIKQSLLLRDRIKQIEAKHTNELAPFKLARDKLNGMLQAFLDHTGQKSARTDEGTVTVSTRYTAKLADPDKFMNYVMKNGAFELMERKANAEACRDHAEENDGRLPPGVNINAWRKLTVTRNNETPSEVFSDE